MKEHVLCLAKVEWVERWCRPGAAKPHAKEIKGTQKMGLDNADAQRRHFEAISSAFAYCVRAYQSQKPLRCCLMATAPHATPAPPVVP